MANFLLNFFNNLNNIHEIINNYQSEVAPPAPELLLKLSNDIE